MFIRSRGSLENHTRFETIMVKVYIRFQTKTAQKAYSLGAAHTYTADIVEYPRVMCRSVVDLPRELNFSGY